MNTVDTGPGSLVLQFLMPEGLPITMNHRLHWSKRASRSKEIRNLAAFTKLSVARHVHLQAAHCVCLFEFRHSRPRDIHNWAPTVKTAIDGLVEGPRRRRPEEGPWPQRLLDDDSGRYLTGPDLREGLDPDLPSGKVRLTLTFTERPIS